MYVIAAPYEADLLPEGADYIVTGVGGLNVISALREIPRDTEIINVGYAGSNILPIGERVKIGRVALYHPHVQYTETIFTLGNGVMCFTSCDFVTETNIEIPCVFDMELAFILAMGFKNVKAEKVISDNLNLKEFEKYGKTKN